MNITITEKEQKLLQKILGIGVYNGNHIEPVAFNPTSEEYKTLCDVFNKVNMA